VKQKLNEYRGLVKSYLKTHKDFCQDIQKRILKSEIQITDIKAKFSLIIRSKLDSKEPPKLTEKNSVQK